MATVNDTLLLDSVGKHAGVKGARQEIVDIFKKQGVMFERTILSDNELAHKLIEELSLRKVDGIS